jgi:hypothetical protein
VSVPYSTFRVAITDLLRTGETPTYQWISQFSDLNFQHPINDGRTASVVLSMYDPVVASLVPYHQALAIDYLRPGVSPADAERIFWGQFNVVDDFAAGTVTLQAQDPSLRLQHHYLRLGDDALNNPHNPKQGDIHKDGRGISTLVPAGYTPLDPSIAPLGLATHNRAADRTPTLHVERGQEIWDLIQQIIDGVGTPEIDMRVNQNDDGSLPTGAVSTEGVCYSILNIYDYAFSGGTELRRDLKSTVIFEYNGPSDNVASAQITPTLPINDAVLVDSAQSWRSRAFDELERRAEGIFQMWDSIPNRIGWGTLDVLEEGAKVYVKTYGKALQQIELELRPDTGQDFFYGDWRSGTVVGDFYIGDEVTVRATKGYRSLDAGYRIVAVELSMSGPRGPITTKLSLIPNGLVDDIDISVESANTDI